MRLLAVISLALLAAAVVAGPAGAATKRPPGVSVARHVVPLHAPITGVAPESCTWTREGARLLCGFDLGAHGVEVGTLRPDGSAFACLTCRAHLKGRPGYLYAFPDGKRFFFGTLPAGAGNASSGSNVSPHVGECHPRISRCLRLVVKDVTTPAVAGDLNDREPRISPDGRHFLWTVVRTDGFLVLMGDLRAAGGAYRVDDVRVLTAVPAPHSTRQWSARGAFNEGKAFDGGSRLIFASTRGGGVNVDDYLLDLSTGRTTRLTHNLEWDEDAQFDPSSRYLILGSARRMHNQVRTTALADVPPFLDAAVIVALAPASLATDRMRLHTLEKWLTTLRIERAGGDGEMLNSKVGGWSGSASKSPWSPEGRRVAWAERGRGGATRLVVVRFPQLRRQRLLCVDRKTRARCTTPTPRWAPRIEHYPALAPGAYTIPGPRGGSATLTYTGMVIGPENRVQFDGFVAADGRIFDGTIEAAGLALGGTSQTVRADVRISGTHHGHTTSAVSAIGKRVCGTADTVLDGRRLHVNIGQWNPECGFKTPRRCPDGADADATGTGDCSRDGLPSRFAAPVWQRH